MDTGRSRKDRASAFLTHVDDLRLGRSCAEGTVLLRPTCCCSATMSSLTVQRKCPHYGECDIDAARTGKTSGTQQLTGGIYDDGAGSDTDGSEHTPHQAYSDGIQEGRAAAIAHGNRGRRPANATPETVSASIVHLARTRYAGVNHTHMSELLREHEGIDVTRSTLRRLLVSAGENSPRGGVHPSIASVGRGCLARVC